MTDKEQASLLEALAGKRQGQIIAAILNNFDTVESSLESMKNSAGSAEREMEIVSESLQFKLNALRETGVGIAQNLFDKGDLGTLIDGLTSVVGVIDKVTEKLGLFGSVGAGLGIFELFKHGSTVANIIEAITGIGSLGTVFGTLGGAAAGGAALYFILDKVGTSLDDLNNAAKQSRNDYEEAQATLKSYNDELATTQQRIQELEGKGNLELSEQQELDRLKRENEQLERRIQLEERIAELTQRDAANKANAFFTEEDEHTGTNIIDKYNKEQSRLLQLQNQEAELTERLSKYSAEDVNGREYQADMAERERIINEMAELQTTMAEEQSTMATNYRSMIDENGMIIEGCLESARMFNDATKYVGTETEQAAQKQAELSSILEQDAYAKPLESIQKYIEETGNADVSIEKMEELFDNEDLMYQFQNDLANAGVSLAEFKYSLSGIGDELGKMTPEELKASAEEAIKSLDALHQSMFANDFNKMDFTTQSGLLETIDEMNKIKAKPDVDFSDVENANRIIAYCTQQLQELERPAIMDIDTSGLSDGQRKLLGLLQEFQTLQNERNLQVTVGADTSQTDAKLEQLRGQIESASAELPVKANVDTSSVEGVKSAIQNNSFNVQLVPKAATKGLGLEQQGVINYKNQVTKLPEQKATGTVNWGNNTSNVRTTFTAIGTVNWRGANKKFSKNGGNGELHGTAHVYGTAYAGGSWGAGYGGRALVGELGTELLVNSRTGRWETVGDDGAEFINVNPNDIIFNHLQTESLLNNGYALGRGSAFARGTAFASGRAFKKGKKTKSKKSKALEKFQNWFDKLFDWIEIRLERHAKKIERLTKKAEYNADRGNYDSAASGYRSAISSSITQMRNEGTASSKYQSKANAVLNRAVKKGLISKKQANRIRSGIANGRLNISAYGKKMQEVIKDYKEFYDKAQDAKDAIQELREKIYDYIKSLKDLRKAQRDAKVELSETYSGIATSGLNNNAAFAKSQLKERNRQLAAQQEAYAEGVSDLSNDISGRFSKSQSSASSAASKALSNSKKLKVKNKNGKKVKLTTKQREAYENAIKTAQKCIKEGKKIPSKTLKVIKKYNTSLYNQFYSYNENLEIAGDIDKVMEEARLEAANNYAETSAEIYKNQLEMTDTLNDEQENLIDRYGKQSNAANSAAEKNAFLARAASSYDTIVANRRSLISSLGTSMQTNADVITGGKGTTSAFKALASDSKKRSSVQTYINKAKSAVSSVKPIDATTLAKLAQYYSEGYVTYDFYVACVNYNNALNAKEQAEAQLIIDEATAKLEKESIGQERFENVQKEYANEQDLLTAKQDVNKARGVALTANDYQALIRSYGAEINALNQIISENLKLGYWTEESQEYKEAIVKLQDLTKSQIEYNNSLAQLPYDTLEKAMKRLDAIEKYYDSILDLNSQLGRDSSESDYINQIEQNEAKLIKAQEQAQQAMHDWQTALVSPDNVYGGKTASEWETTYYEYLADINSIQSGIDKLRDSMRDDVYWRGFERMHDLASRTETTLEGMAKLIDDNTAFDENGALTKFGVTKIALLAKEYENARQEVSNYSDDIRNLNELYNRGLYTEIEYQEKLSDLQKNLLNSAADMKSYISDIKDMYKDMNQEELDKLNDIIDARQKALKAKKSYYDYDKTLRDKNKDIQELTAQIAALEGINTAEARAKMAQLQEKLSEAQEELEETKREHYFDLSSDALDEMQDVLKDEFDEKWKKLGIDLNDLKQLLADADQISAQSASDVVATLNKLLAFYGINPTASNIATFAEGTRRISSSIVGLSNEAGSEILVTKNGIISHFNPGDGVIPSTLTRRLYAMANGDLSSIGGGAMGAVEVNQHYDSLINIEGSADAATVEDLKRLSKDLLKESYAYTSQKIHEGYLKAGGRRRI